MRIIMPRKFRDQAFMEYSKEILNNIPDTWKAYPQTIEGAMSIIDMEHKELLQPTANKSKELVHLATACLYAWRMLNHAE